MLSIIDLSVTFTTSYGNVDAVRNVSLSIGKGETVALVGESGSGKSVTALSVLGLLPYPLATHPSGQIRFHGKELLRAPDTLLQKIRGNQIGMIFQEPMLALNPLHTVLKQITEVLMLHKGMGPKEARERTMDLLNLVNIQDPNQKVLAYPHQLSGGQRQRVMIAMALANEPDLLIADEPTTAVDVTVQAQILTLLKQLQQQLDMSLLLITHDLDVVRKTSERVYVMKNGAIVEQGLTNETLRKPTATYTQQLIQSEPSGVPNPVKDAASAILQSKGLRVWFPIQRGIFRRTVNHVKAVDDISIEIRAGETIGIVGESGSGKTTLALALARLVSSKGPIVFLQQSIQNLKNRDLKPLRRDLQIVFQDPYGSLSPRMSVGQIIEEGLIAHGIGSDSTRARLTTEALEEVGVDPDSRHRYPHEFSGGQRQRIALARAIILQPKLVILDEPTSALDRTVQAQIIDLLRQLQQQKNLAYLFISHDLKVIRALSHKIIVLQKGRVVEQGQTQHIFNDPQDDYTKALLSAAYDLEIEKTSTAVLQ
ncbi:MAG: microcin ABC transporter ATP-binding protein [Acidiferrobacteraceae bacterium]|nr:microcin ABC transporter ATP-binding protein [Acidiferrobacteraceae bacterium]